MKRSILLKCLLVGVVTSVGALADMTVDKSNGALTITSDTSGVVIAKIVGPDNKIVVNEKYEGNSFSWTPEGADGVYRYDVRIKGDHIGGSVNIKNEKLAKRRDRK
jgi:hypothetical protein